MIHANPQFRMIVDAPCECAACSWERGKKTPALEEWERSLGLAERRQRDIDAIRGTTPDAREAWGSGFDAGARGASLPSIIEREAGKGDPIARSWRNGWESGSIARRSSSW